MVTKKFLSFYLPKAYFIKKRFLFQSFISLFYILFFTIAYAYIEKS